MAVNLDTLSDLLNEAEDLVRRCKNEIARLSNEATTDIKDEAVQASGDSADQTAASTTTDEPGEPIGSDSGPNVAGEATEGLPEAAAPAENTESAPSTDDSSTGESAGTETAAPAPETAETSASDGSAETPAAPTETASA